MHDRKQIATWNRIVVRLKLFHFLDQRSSHTKGHLPCMKFESLGDEMSTINYFYSSIN